MLWMTVITALAGLVLIAFPAFAAAQGTGVTRTDTPLVISDKTIGILRQHQVGLIILPKSKRPFRAVVAFYPYCPKVAPPLANDLLILIGDADNWASAARCSVYVNKYQTETAHRPYLRVYPGARHSFDAKRPERVYFGHRLAYDPKATADAIERTRKFLNDHLGAK